MFDYKSNLNVTSLFPTAVATLDCPLDNSVAVELFEKCDLHNSTSKYVTEFGDLSKNTYMLDNYKCKELNNWIIKAVECFSKEVLGLKASTYIFLQSWVTVKYPQQHHKPHTHPNSIVSGVFYWQTHDIEPINFFKSNNASEQLGFMVHTEKPTIYNNKIHSVSPRPNSIVLFPSNLQHSVAVNTTNIPRKSLAFNTIPLEGLGDSGFLTELDFHRIALKNTNSNLKLLKKFS